MQDRNNNNVDLIHFGQKHHLFTCLLPYARGQLVMLSGGLRLIDRLKRFLETFFNLEEVVTPSMYTSPLWRCSGHLDYFQHAMFKLEGANLYLKPMSCPAHFELLSRRKIYLKDLPYGIREYGVVHRKEAYGAIKFMFRMNKFTQDDAHILVTWGLLRDWIAYFTRVTELLYLRFGFGQVRYRICLSTTGSNAKLRLANLILIWCFLSIRRHAVIVPDDGAFYGPKVEAHLLDQNGKTWQCGTIQLDLEASSKFNIRVRHEGSFIHPIVLHQACLGSLERFIGILSSTIPYLAWPLSIHPTPYCLVQVSENLTLPQELRFVSARYTLKEMSRLKLQVPLILIYGPMESQEGCVSLYYSHTSRQIKVPLGEVRQHIRGLYASLQWTRI